MTNLQRMGVFAPKGQCPSKVDHSVNGEVKLHRKKSDRDKARMNEFLGSVRNFLVVIMVRRRMAFKDVPKIMMGRYSPRRSL